MVDPSSTPQLPKQCFCEVFCSDLPSPCNLYLSGKRCSRGRALTRARVVPSAAHDRIHCGRHHPRKGKRASPASIMRFATERHSLALLRKDGIQRRGDGYYLSVSHLPSSPSVASRKDAEKDAIRQKLAEKKSTATSTTKDSEENKVDVCLGHSSVFCQMPDISHSDENNGSFQSDQYQESSVEVFAMMKNTPPADNANSKEQKSSDNNSLTTHGSHSISVSEAGKDAGGDITDQKLTSAVDATTGSSARNEGGENGPASSSNYYLLVRTRILPEKMMERETNDQTMHDLYIDGVLQSGSHKPSLTSSRINSMVETIPLDFRPMSAHAAVLHIASTDAKSEPSCPSAVGIFVASADDNRLRLYVSTKKALQRSTLEPHTQNKPCFSVVSLNHITAASDVPGFDMSDKSMSEPLLFSTPIMAIETCVTGEVYPPSLSGNEEKSVMELNRLAIACYDGNVRILTYQLKTDRDDDSVLHFHQLRSSAFIVDGPVVSLRFGGVSTPPEFQLPEPSPLYLVAGSLCGFACIFYEITLPLSEENSQSSRTHFFDEPVTVVDGLYDAQREGYEDSVTCVGVTQNQMILVGTQGGRVLLFKRCQKDSKTQNMNDKKDMCLSLISQREREMSKLRSERVEMEHEAAALNGIISDMRIKIQDVTHMLNETKSEKIVLNTASEKCDTRESIPSDELSHFQTMKASETELSFLEQNMLAYEAKESEILSNVGTLKKRFDGERTTLLRQGVIHSRGTRRIHRYKFLWDCHLPYPIYGITSADFDGSGDEVFVSTRRSFHIFRQYYANIDAVEVHGLASITEEKIAKLLST
mmetsp:Transcript_6321/g.15727  ORF Transcript_6321/g.15727 Transcript_6321/m.15727 type:complete len:817 (-) Transcript_6321:24-2474(-)